QEMRVHALRLEAGGRRELPQDQERAGPGEGPALGVQEQLGPVPAVEVRAAARQVTPECLGGLSTDRDDPLLAALARAADESPLEVDAGEIGRASGRGRVRAVGGVERGRA